MPSLVSAVWSGPFQLASLPEGLQFGCNGDDPRANGGRHPTYFGGVEVWEMIWPTIVAELC